MTSAIPQNYQDLWWLTLTGPQIVHYFESACKSTNLSTHNEVKCQNTGAELRKLRYLACWLTRRHSNQMVWTTHHRSPSNIADDSSSLFLTKFGLLSNEQRPVIIFRQSNEWPETHVHIPAQVSPLWSCKHELPCHSHRLQCEAPQMESYSSKELLNLDRQTLLVEHRHVLLDNWTEQRTPGESYQQW